MSEKNVIYLVVKSKIDTTVGKFILNNKLTMTEVLALDYERIRSLMPNPYELESNVADPDDVTEEENTEIVNKYIENKIVEWNDNQTSIVMKAGRTYRFRFLQIYDGMLNPLELIVDELDSYIEGDSEIIDINVDE